MKGKSLVLALLGGIFALLGFVFWLGLNGGGKGNSPAPAASSSASSAVKAAERDAEPEAASTTAGVDEGDAAADARVEEKPAWPTTFDPKARTTLRKKLLVAWKKTDGVLAPPPDPFGKNILKAGGDVGFGDGGVGVPARFVGRLMARDFRPIVDECRRELTARKPDAAGRVYLELTMVNDKDLGGLVEHARIGESSTLKDDRFGGCLTKGLLAMTFAPAPSTATIQVTFPLVLAADAGVP